MTLEKFAKAFQLWEEGFRAEPDKFLTNEECAEMQVSELSANRAEYFVELMKEIEKE